MKRVSLNVLFLLSWFSCFSGGDRPKQPIGMLGISGDAYHFPWLCRIKLYGEEQQFTIASLFTDNWLFSSADNWNKFAMSRPALTYFEILYKDGGELFRVNGIKQMLPTEVPEATISHLYIATTPEIVNSTPAQAQKMFLVDPPKMDTVSFDVIGVTTGVVLVKTVGSKQFGEHVWTYEMLPIPLFSVSIAEIETEINFWAKQLESTPLKLTSCSAATLRNIPGLENPHLVYQQMTYIPAKDCRSAFCAEDLSACLLYPAHKYQLCFKPNQYTDFCDVDQGTALWCPWFKDSVFAILTHADSCGIRNLPSVYTLIHVPLRLWAAAVKQDDLKIPPRPDYKQYSFVVPFFPTHSYN